VFDVEVVVGIVDLLVVEGWTSAGVTSARITTFKEI
jgi:hypothetical protein